MSEIQFCLHDNKVLCEKCAVGLVQEIQKAEADKSALREAIQDIKEMMPKPCEHFPFHGSVMETIDDALHPQDPPAEGKGDGVRLIDERLAQHRENLRLWESGYLDPTEPSETERFATKERLKAAIHELEIVRESLKGREGGQ